MRSYSDCLSAAGGGERGLMMESRRPGEIERSKIFPHMMDEDGARPLRGRHHRLVAALDGVLLSSEGSNEPIPADPTQRNEWSSHVQSYTLIVRIHFCLIYLEEWAKQHPELYSYISLHFPIMLCGNKRIESSFHVFYSLHVPMHSISKQVDRNQIALHMSNPFHTMKLLHKVVT